MTSTRFQLQKQFFFASSIFLLFFFFSSSCNKNVAPEITLEDTVLLISLDGFRYDYLDLVETPGFDELTQSGVQAEGLIPVFPSKTFPNHYSQVTGLHPDNHGLIANTMYDPSDDTWFRIGQGSTSVLESKWYGGEPIWVTAEKQNMIAATYFWPGSEAEIKDTRPSYYEVYNGSIPNADRIKQVLKWLDLPADKRPQLITLYMNDTDNAGHATGPGTEVVKSAVQALDEQIQLLITGLKERNLFNQVNIIIVSDHGMSQLSRERVIFLDDYIDLDDVEMVDWSPISMIIPNEGKEEVVYSALKDQHPHMRVYKKGEIPAYLNFNDNRLIPPLVCIADDGWSITNRDVYNDRPNSFQGGTHGYDFTAKSMQGVFIASGPAFKENYQGEAFQNIHLYERMCNILGLTPAINDGTLDITSEYINID
jgi:ectonucleotide pyrophosphatase/phosphodiesterase family protein 5